MRTHADAIDRIFHAVYAGMRESFSFYAVKMRYREFFLPIRHHETEMPRRHCFSLRCCLTSPCPRHACFSRAPLAVARSTSPPPPCRRLFLSLPSYHHPSSLLIKCVLRENNVFQCRLFHLGCYSVCVVTYKMPRTPYSSSSLIEETEYRESG